MRSCRICLLTVLAAAGAGGAPAGGGYDEWLRYRDGLRSDPTVVRYYTFEDVSETRRQVANLAGDEGALAYELLRVEGAPEARFTIVDGRWPGKTAVRLDQDRFAGAAPAAPSEGFTAAGWFRMHGPGSHRGNNAGTNGTLLSVGIGYWDGWRITTRYPQRTVNFEIGRPQPVNAIGVGGTVAVSDGVWHHIAATWDRAEMRLYVDGRTVARRAYDGDYYPPPQDPRFRIGYAGYGFGSVILDVDEVVVYRRALSPEEVLSAAHFCAPFGEGQVARFRAAREAVEQGRGNEAVAALESLLGEADLAPDLAAVARLELAAVQRERNRPADAVRQLAAVADDQTVAECHRRSATEQILALAGAVPGDVLPVTLLERLLANPELAPDQVWATRVNLARSLRSAGDHAAAAEQLRALLAGAPAGSKEAIDVTFELGHTLLAARDYAGARAEYERIADDAAAPAHLRSLAQLRVADTFERGGDRTGARAALERVAAIPDAPPHLCWEAEERSAELLRLEQGLPRRDPTANRTHLPPMPEPGLELYVAPDGNDRAAGTKDEPLATVAGARDAIRERRRAGGLPPGGVVVHLLPGEYPLDESLAFTAEDSGTADAPIVYRAETRGEAMLSGGVRLSGWSAVTDPAVLARLPEEARGAVRQLDLRAAGITDYGEPRPRGFGTGSNPWIELFFDGRAMRRARYPNRGFLTTGEVLVKGTRAENQGATFRYDDGRPERWSQAKDIWMWGTWTFHWADDNVPVAALDATKREVAAGATTAYGTTAGNRFFFYNLLEEIDEPGEWYLDRDAGVLYFYPPGDPNEADVRLSMLAKPLVTMTDVAHVILDGLRIAYGRSDGVAIRGGEHCLLLGCTIGSLGQTGVRIDGGAHHGVLGCDIHTTGDNGTWIRGGDRKTLTPSGHFVENCHIWDFSRVNRTYTPAVWTDGVGTRIAHNLFHDSPHHAMRLEGNDHVVEFNEIHSVVYESDDQAGLDIFHNPSYRGIVVRYNYWHHIGSGLDRNGQAGIRLDDAISGVLMYSNVFYRSSGGFFGAIQIHGGKENIVDNNLFVDCRTAVSFSPWGPAGWQRYLDREDVKRKLYEEVDITQPPYSTRYPELARIAENPDRNSVWRSLVVNCGSFLLRDRGVTDLADNFVTLEDPGLVDPAHGDFSLPEQAAVYDRLGFRPIPFSEIGLYASEYRASWPVKTTITPHYQGPEE